ncbi:MAG: adenylosuccinate synthase [Verrucomicrobia bacterium]|nr:MAG: adenylosuccinate synthase [Verrucomicrobiota bacterium]
MANTILVGAQWGDEGKGKIIDVLTEQADIVVRSQGGANAGHTVIVGDQQYILHLVPSGILRPRKQCVIGNGVVVDPFALVEEIRMLEELGVKVDGKLHLSDAAHLVMPYHRLLDACRETRRRGRKIGTTRRGIGPAYADKAARTGLRVMDLIDEERFPAMLKERIRENNAVLKTFGEKPLSYAKVLADCRAAAERLRPLVTNTVVWLNRQIQRGKNVLFEGAQGTFLDIDHGTYPYVTSSNTTAGGACTGSGVAPNRIDRVVGVTKAYTTRVGEGPFPTESEELGDLLHSMGREFGATTGRPRRCGWFDAVLARHAAMINGMDEIAVTNLDGLDTLERLRICVGYRLHGRKLDHVPANLHDLAACEPIYRELPGWRQSTAGARTWKDLPAGARRYLETIAGLMGAKLRIVSVGPARDQTIFLD